MTSTDNAHETMTHELAAALGRVDAVALRIEAGALTDPADIAWALHEATVVR